MKYINQIIVVVLCLIGFGTYYSIQNNKIEAQRSKELRAETTASLKQIRYDNCVEKADEAYWNYMEMNGKGDRKEGVTAAQYVWNNAKATKKDDIDNCFDQYKK